MITEEPCSPCEAAVLVPGHPAFAHSGDRVALKVILSDEGRICLSQGCADTAKAVELGCQALPEETVVYL